MASKASHSGGRQAERRRPARRQHQRRRDPEGSSFQPRASKWASDSPEPLTTQVRGESATETGRRPVPESPSGPGRRPRAHGGCWSRRQDPARRWSVHAERSGRVRVRGPLPPTQRMEPDAPGRGGGAGRTRQDHRRGGRRWCSATTAPWCGEFRPAAPRPALDSSQERRARGQRRGQRLPAGPVGACASRRQESIIRPHG